MTAFGRPRMPESGCGIWRAPDIGPWFIPSTICRGQRPSVSVGPVRRWFPVDKEAHLRMGGTTPLLANAASSTTTSHLRPMRMAIAALPTRSDFSMRRDWAQYGRWRSPQRPAISAATRAGRTHKRTGASENAPADPWPAGPWPYFSREMTTVLSSVNVSREWRPPTRPTPDCEPARPPNGR